MLCVTFKRAEITRNFHNKKFSEKYLNLCNKFNSSIESCPEIITLLIISISHRLLGLGINLNQITALPDQIRPDLR